ncbi:MAG: glycosyltransferase [Pseudomonadota bacterium]
MYIKRLLGKSLDYIDKRFCATVIKTEIIGNACLAYDRKHPIFIREYYLYCVDLLRQVLASGGIPINVIVGDYKVKFPNRQSTIRVDIQFEHTLVKSGGRDSTAAVTGNIPIHGTRDCYLVRICNYDYLNSLDLIVDYSLPNISNIRASGEFASYTSKTILIHPLLYDADFGNSNRLGHIVTLFADCNQPRRKLFLEKSLNAGLPLNNVKGIFDKSALQKLYMNTKILVNMRQTEHHDTLEELRLLPALMCGVIIISEDAPLKELVPYSEFVIWSSYENMVDTIRSVYENYGEHYQRIFSKPGLAEVLTRMKKTNLEGVHTAVQRLRNG